MSERGLQGFKSRSSLGASEVDIRDRGGGSNIGAKQPRYFALESGVRGGPRASGSGVEWKKEAQNGQSHSE